MSSGEQSCPSIELPSHPWPPCKWNCLLRASWFTEPHPAPKFCVTPSLELGQAELPDTRPSLWPSLPERRPGSDRRCRRGQAPPDLGVGAEGMEVSQGWKSRGVLIQGVAGANLGVAGANLSVTWVLVAVRAAVSRAPGPGQEYCASQESERVRLRLLGSWEAHLQGQGARGPPGQGGASTA